MANIPFLNNTSFSAAITVANSATASNFITTTDSGININGITLTRVAANSAIRVSQGLETLGLLRSYSNLIVATTGTFGGDVSVEDNLYLTDSGTVRGKIQLNSSDRDDLDIKAVSLSSNMKFFTVDTERMRIDSSGNVGIGTTAPSQKLHISGNMRLTGAFRDRLNSQGAANYVLTSTGSNGTQWVDASGSSIIGGPYLPLDGGTMTGTNGVVFPDAFKLNLGTGSDLQIYHDGSNSYIQDTSGTGDLIVDTSTFRLRSANGGETMIRAFEDGAVILSYNTFDKLFTTSTGVSVTGEGIFTGNVGIGTTSPSYPLDVVGDGIRLTRNSKTFIFNADFASAGTHANIQSDAGMGLSFSTNASEKMRITSAGNVGIGTDSPDRKLEVDFTGSVFGARFTRSDATGSSVIEFANSGGVKSIIGYDAGVDGYIIGTTSATNFVVKQSGNVGIGTTSPVSKLDIRGRTDINLGAEGLYFKAGGDTANNGRPLEFTSSSNNGSNGALHTINATSGNGAMSLNTAGVSRIYMDRLGLVGIGTTSPTAKLHVAGTGLFTGLVSGITPVAAANFVTKAYVDGSGGGTGPFLPLAGGTMTGTAGVLMPDNFKLKFGDATTPDLEIYHDGSHSRIKDAGAGSLTINATDFVVNNSADTKNMIIAVDGGATTLFCNGANRLATTSTGVTVTGNGIFTGNVGIGTTSPSNKLDVQITTSNRTTLEPVLSVSASGNGPYTGFGPKISFDSNIYYGAATGNPAGIIETAYIGAVMGTTYATNSDLVFATRDGATSVTEKMRILGNGNVGIGTTSPSARLNVIHTASTSIPALQIASSASLASNDIVRFQINGLTNGFRMFQDASSVLNYTFQDGNVGIGTTGPDSKLHIKGISTIEEATAGAGTQLKFVGQDSSGHFNFLVGKQYNVSNAFEITPSTAVNGTTFTNPAFIVNSSGNVGIGTTSPNRKLQVVGTDGAAKFYYNSSFTNAQYSVVDVGMMTSGTAANGFGPKITFRMGGNGYDGYATGTIGTIRNGADNTHNLNFGTSNSGSMTTKMTITNAGNVGIGTATPTAPLHIEGGTNSEVLKVEADANPYIRWVQNGTNVGFLQFNGGSAYLSNMANGSFFFRTNNSDKMTILSGGNVGIGVTGPTEKLQVAGNAAFYGAIKGYVGSSSNQYLSILQSSSLTYISTGTTNETIYFGIGPVANVTNINVAGTATATNFILSSDKTLKDKIKDIKTNHVDVKWKNFELISEPGVKRSGVIAQELEAKHPEFIRTDKDGLKSVAYIDLLITKIAELEARLEKAGL